MCSYRFNRAGVHCFPNGISEGFVIGINEYLFVGGHGIIFNLGVNSSLGVFLFMSDVIYYLIASGVVLYRGTIRTIFVCDLICSVL